MNNSLSLGKLIPVSLVLFSSFFGAGNLLFPPLFGYLAGSNLNIATLGFCITGVSLPILGVLAIAMTGGTDLTEVAAPVNIAYAKIIKEEEENLKNFTVRGRMKEVKQQYIEAHDRPEDFE